MDYFLAIAEVFLVLSSFCKLELFELVVCGLYLLQLLQDPFHWKTIMIFKL